MTTNITVTTLREINRNLVLPKTIQIESNLIRFTDDQDNLFEVIDRTGTNKGYITSRLQIKVNGSTLFDTSFSESDGVREELINLFDRAENILAMQIGQKSRKDIDILDKFLKGK